MFFLIIHHKRQEEQHHTIPHLWRAWWCREGETIGWPRDLILGDATRCCMDVSVVWLGRPNRFMTSTEMRFFWLPLSTMNCSGEPFTDIREWKRGPPSSGSSVSSFWILVVATMVLGSASIISFPFLFLLLGSDSESEHASDYEAFNLATNNCLARHSLVFWVGLLWNSHHFLVAEDAQACSNNGRGELLWNPWFN